MTGKSVQSNDDIDDACCEHEITMLGDGDWRIDANGSSIPEDAIREQQVGVVANITVFCVKTW